MSRNTTLAVSTAAIFIGIGITAASDVSDGTIVAVALAGMFVMGALVARLSD